MDIAKNSSTPNNINPYLTLSRLPQLSQNVFYNWFIVITIHTRPTIHLIVVSYESFILEPTPSSSIQLNLSKMNFFNHFLIFGT